MRYSILVFALLISYWAVSQNFVPGFNSVGYRVQNIETTNSLINGSKFVSSAIQPDNKIILGGNNNDLAGSGTLHRYNTDGTLDASFGAAGVVLVSAFAVNDIALQADGKILAVGVVWDGIGTNAMCVERFNANGNVDSSFGINGRIHHTIGYQRAYPSSIYVQPNGQILLTGTTDEYNIAGYGEIRMGIIKLNSNGSLDNSFDGDGKKVISVPGSTGCDGYDITTQADNKIVASGIVYNPGVRKPVVIRMLPDGTFDNTFNGTGILVENYSSNSFAYNVAVRPNGKIVMLGDTYDASNFYFRPLLIQYNSDGTRDNSFGSAGVASNNSVVVGNCNTNRMKLLTDGRVLIAGTYNGSGSNRLGVLLYDVNGVLDPLLNGSGFLASNFEPTNFDISWAINAYDDGKFFVAGCRNTNADLRYYAIAKYNANGSRDLSFNITGISMPFTNGSTDEGRAIAIQADGKIVVAGLTSKFLTTNNINYSIVRSVAVVRYNTDGSADASFGTNGIRVVASNFIPQAIAIQSDGKIIIAGEGMRVVRLNTDGSNDNTFGSSGIFTHPALGSGSSIAEGNDIAIQPDGKILISGYTYTNSGATKMSITRLNANGTLDAGFTGGGTREIINGEAHALALLANGNIIISGNDFYTIRLLPNGSTDPSFTATTPYLTNTSSSVAKNIRILADGKILVGGKAVNNTTSQISDFCLARMESDGGADNSFGTFGTARTNISGYSELGVNKIFPQANGTIIAAGDGQNLKDGKSIILTSYNANGSLNTTWGTAGFFTPDVLNGAQETAVSAAQSGTTIYTIGTIVNNSITDFFTTAIDVNTVTLPLQFISFTAQKCNTNNVCLNWKTANEQSVSHFEIERSVDGRNFRSVDTKAAKNQSNNEYNATDNISTVKSQNLYYRIRQVDNDGRNTQTKIIWLKMDDKGISVYPTIVTGWFQVQNNTGNKMNMHLYDATGRIVLQQSVVAGTNAITIGTLSKGIYYYNIRNVENTTVYKGRILKQ